MAAIPVQNLTKDISQAELSQRIAVIKRFRELLKAQRDRFQSYLSALDKQKNVIETGTADDLLRHVELEEKIVEDIFSIQKVIDPLEKMYQSVSASEKKGPLPDPKGTLAYRDRDKYSDKNADEEEVSGLKEALEGLKAEAVVRSAKNRELLAKRMAELRLEIKSLKSAAYTRQKFSENPAPSLIDLKG
jgi:hypothetical protein